MLLENLVPFSGVKCPITHASQLNFCYVFKTSEFQAIYIHGCRLVSSFGLTVGVGDEVPFDREAAPFVDVLGVWCSLTVPV